MKRNEKKLLIEQKIIRAIIDNYENKDIGDMSADEIASIAHVSKRTLYQYFASKKEMYLGAVKYCFMELAEQIESAFEQNVLDNPFAQIECIGRCYLSYCLANRAKSKLISQFNENDYVSEYPEYVNSIVEYSNKFELSGYIRQYYAQISRTPSISISSLTLYLWSHVQGFAALTLAKRSWLEDYYGVDMDEMINEHLRISESILEGAIE